MKLVRFRRKGQAQWGVLENSEVWASRGSVYEAFEVGKRVGALDDVEMLAPCEPTKVLALAYNYKDLVGEREHYDEPLIFLKSVTSVVPFHAPISIPSGLSKVWVEAELAFVIKRGGRHISPEDAPEHILGYTIANDVTAANVHGRDHHLARSKGLDTFCPVGLTLDTQIATGDLALCTRINGRVTQRGTTANRILNDVECLSLLSRFFTLAPGDLVLTGTPAGAMDSIIKPGDEAVLEIAGLGRLSNPIAAV